jgi:Calx-beta domain
MSQSYNVAITGDTAVEPSESFFLNLTQPTNATLADAQAQAMIMNDDSTAPPPPAPNGDIKIFVDNASRAEGNSGVANLLFSVHLSAASNQVITVRYYTEDKTALAGSDYVATGGPLTFQPGETTKTVAVGINGDSVREDGESFSLWLTDLVNVKAGDRRANGSIRNDDTAAMAVAIASNQMQSDLAKQRGSAATR